MKVLIRNTIITALTLLVLLCQTAWAGDLSNLVILHTNDSHGFDMHDDSHNGMPVIAALKEKLQEQGYDVILLSAGDFTQDNNLVNFRKGAAAIDIFNAAGYDAATLGNHEFDYGQDVLKHNVAIAKFPIISANILVDATGKNLVKPYTIIQKGKTKIGVIGMTTPETVVSTNPKNTYGLNFLSGKDMYKCIQSNVDILKKKGCELIIAIGHMGSSESYMGNRSDDVLENVKGIDIFVDGHDHLIKNRYINGALLAETGYYTTNIGCIRLEDGVWTENLIPYGQYLEEDNRVKEIIDEEQAKIDASMSEVQGISKVTLTGKRVPGVRTMETNSGDFFADAYLWQANKAQALKQPIDLAICNGGSIRSEIAAGNVTKGDVSNAMPYNNQLYVVSITGEKLLEILEAATCITPDALGAFPQVAGMEYEINTSVEYAKGAQYENSVFYAPAKPGSRVTIKKVAGKDFDPNAVYTVAATEFLVYGGDAYGGLVGRDSKIDLQAIGYTDAEAVSHYLMEGLNGVIGEEYAESQGRIIIK